MKGIIGTSRISQYLELKLNNITGSFNGKLDSTITGDIIQSNNIIEFDFNDYNSSNYKDATYKMELSLSLVDDSSTSTLLNNVKAEDATGAPIGINDVNETKTLPKNSSEKINLSGKYIFPTEEDYLKDGDLVLEPINLNLDTTMDYSYDITSSKEYSYNPDILPETLDVKNNSLEYPIGYKVTKSMVDDIIKDAGITITDGYITKYNSDEMLNSPRFSTEINGSSSGSIDTSVAGTNTVTVKYLSLSG